MESHGSGRRRRGSPTLMARPTRDYDESDARVRPNPRGSRPRSKDRPAHDDAVQGLVTAVDRGRYTVLVDAGTPSRGRTLNGSSRPCAPASSAARASSSATRRPRRGRLGRPRVARPHRPGRGAHPGAATHGRRHRPGRTGHRRRRRPARHRLGTGEPRASATPHRPVPRRRIRRRYGSTARADQGRSRRRGGLPQRLRPARGSLRRDPARRRHRRP